MQEFVASGHPEVRCSGTFSEGRAQKEGEKNLVHSARRPELCGNIVEDTRRRQPIQHPLSNGNVVQQQRHGGFALSQPERRDRAGVGSKLVRFVVADGECNEFSVEI